MEQIYNNAHTRLRERVFTIWEEAGGDPSVAYASWHRLRPMVSGDDFPGMAGTPKPAAPQARKPAPPAKA